MKIVFALYNLGPMVPSPTGILRLSYRGPTHFLLKEHESPFNPVMRYGMQNVNEVPGSLNLSLTQSELGLFCKHKPENQNKVKYCC